MNIIRTSIKRPVAVSMFYFSIFLIGLYFTGKIPIELLPDFEFPRLTVSTSWPQTSPVIVESFVTSPIEAIASTIKGVNKVKSTSTEGLSLVSIEFTRDTNMDFAALELSEKLSLIKENLPSGAFEPQILKYIPEEFRTQGFLIYRLTGALSLQELRKFAKNRIEIPLKSIDGVADVEVIGGMDREIRIEIDRHKADLFNVSDEKIINAINDMDIKIDSGKLYRTGISYDVFVFNRLKNVNEISNIVVDKKEGNLIRLKDLADVIDTYKEPFSLYRINGNPAVIIDIKREAGTNTIVVANRVFKKIEELKKGFPPSIKIIKDVDQSERIKIELKNLLSRSVFCVLIIFIVLLIFLRSFKVPVVILSTIFFSELLTIILFYFAGTGLNLITLAGLALGFGMLVDNSIVVLDNIYRYKEREKLIEDAAEKGTKEISLPIIASTLTTVVVFLPFLYMTGENRLNYIPLAMAVAFSLLSSLIVAFTFIPSVSCKMFAEVGERKIKSKNKLIDFITKKYSTFLKVILKYRIATVLCAVLIFSGSYFLFDKYVTKGRIWSSYGDDTYIRVNIKMPEGSEIEQADMIARMFENKILGNPYVAKVSTQISREYVTIRVDFPDSIKFTVKPLILKDMLTVYAAGMGGISVGVYGFGAGFYTGGSFSTQGFRINVLGYNFNEVKRIAEEIGKILAKTGRVDNIDTNSSGWFHQNKIYETNLRIKRNKISEYNITIRDVVFTVQKYLKGTIYNRKLKIKGEEIDYSLKYKGFRDFQVSDLENLLITTNSDEKVRLSSIAEITKRKVMNRIERKNQQYNRVVFFEYRGPFQMGVKLVNSIIKNTHLPEGYKLDKEFRLFISESEKKEIYFVILMAIILVYMVISALYESFLHPFIILLTVPMALIGVFLIFFFLDKNFDRTAYIGVILLAGIVVNNAIILVDQINLLRRKGIPVYSAIINGCLNRIRPILMTTITTIAGLLPLILFTSYKTTGESIWYSLSIATIGGLLLSTPLTLTVIPALYLLIEEIKFKIKKSFIGDS